MAAENLHEDPNDLSPEVKDRHRAIRSLMEELEAVDWYDQRVEACTDPELRDVLAHNRDEEKEHAAMMIEWLRRHDAKFDEELRTYLFTEKPLVQAEGEATGQGSSATGSGDKREDPPPSSVGSLRGQ